jgi:hypothetical protein
LPIEPATLEHLGGAAVTVAAIGSALAAVTLEGNTVILNFPHLGAALEAWRPWGSAAKRQDFMNRVNATLIAVGLRVEVQVQGRPIGSIGPGSERGLLHRILTPQPV